MQEEKAFRVYVTEALRNLAGIETHYTDMIDTTPKDERTFEEITKDVWSRIMGGGEK